MYLYAVTVLFLLCELISKHRWQSVFGKSGTSCGNTYEPVQKLYDGTNLSYNSSDFFFQQNTTFTAKTMAIGWWWRLKGMNKFLLY